MKETLRSFGTKIEAVIARLFFLVIAFGGAILLSLSSFALPAVAASNLESIVVTAADFASAEETIDKNVEQILSFSDNHLEAKWVTNIQQYSVAERTVISNVGVEEAKIQGAYETTIAPRSSTIVQNVTIESADSLVLIRIKDLAEIGGVILGEQWDLAGNVIAQYPKDIPLWKSSQDDVGTVEVDPMVLTDQLDRDRPDKKEKFQVKVNLWFATANTNASIHRDHDFLEVHTQIYGIGRMQKFYQEEAATLYEDVIMEPGRTHIPFAHVSEEDKFVYPWHQYYADTDTIWMAIEFHRIDK